MKRKTKYNPKNKSKKVLESRYNIQKDVRFVRKKDDAGWVYMRTLRNAETQKRRIVESRLGKAEETWLDV